MTSFQRQHGYVYLETIISVMLLGMLIGIMSAAVTSQQRAAYRLDERQALIRTANAAAAQVCAGAEARLPDDSLQLTLTPIDVGIQKAGWTQITVANGAREATIFAFTPTTRPAGAQ